MRAIDAWVNLEMPTLPAEWQRQAAARLKRPQEEVFRDTSPEELLAQMDACGIHKAMLMVQNDRPSSRVLDAVAANPERFGLSVLVDPRRGMKALRALQRLAGSHPVRLVRVIPSMLNLPPDDRVYYPLYAKCVELGLPISVNTGIPEPPLPGRCQDPMHLDDVCLFFPDLVIIMAHGADPWWDVAVRLMAKYPNLYMMTSAFAPKYLPSTLLQAMRSRIRDKVMLASDHPFLTMQRCREEAAALDLPAEALDAYLFANAARVLFRENHTR